MVKYRASNLVDSKKQKIGITTEYAILFPDMEKQIPTNTLSAADQPPQSPVTPSNNWAKIVSLVVFIIVLMGGSVLAGIQISRNQFKEITPFSTINTTINQPMQPTSDSTHSVIAPSEYPTPSPNPSTANWKTYTNSTFGYTIKYPNNWDEVPETADTKLLIDRPLNSYLTKQGGDILIFVNKKPSEYTTNKEYFDSKYNQTQTVPGTTIIKKFILSEEPAIMLLETFEPGTILEATEQIEVYVYHKNNIFEIGLTGPKALVDQYKSLFDQILSTLEFLK